MIIKRALTPFLKKAAEQFPVVAVMGPRQSGKTTLVKETFPDYDYVTLEDLDMRVAAQEDPRGFLKVYEGRTGVIIDEIQEVPELFSYMQGIVDQQERPGYFIITGSQHFLMYEKITQTLAGRISLLTLLPLSVDEIEEAGLLPSTLEAVLYKGFYPRVYSKNVSIQSWYINYISTYVEKDVRQVLKISNLVTFQRFLKLCAARVGNLLNYSSLAHDAGISPNTARSWISILEASYLITLIYPYHRNYNKRMIKSPKLYFNDTGLLCALLGIRTVSDLVFHPLKGAIFELYVISECYKYFYNHDDKPHIYFWRDVQGHEVDLILEKSFNYPVPIEIKAGMTLTPTLFKGLGRWKTITHNSFLDSFLVYGGNYTGAYPQAYVFGWKYIEKMLNKIMH